jgi:hypothetical protein
MARTSALNTEPNPAPRAPSGVVDLAALPVILTVREMATIYRLSEYTILKGVRAGTFLRPWDTYPTRWHRDDVLADLELRRRGPAGRRQPLKASLPRRKTATERS